MVVLEGGGGSVSYERGGPVANRFPNPPTPQLGEARNLRGTETRVPKKLGDQSPPQTKTETRNPSPLQGARGGTARPTRSANA